MLGEIWHFDQPILIDDIEPIVLDIRVIPSDGHLKQKGLANDTFSLGHLPKWARKKSQKVVMESSMITNETIWKTPEPVINLSMCSGHLTSSQRERRYKTLLIFGQKKIKWTQFGVDYKTKYPVRSEFARIRERRGGRFVKKIKT